MIRFENCAEFSWYSFMRAIVAETSAFAAMSFVHTNSAVEPTLIHTGLQGLVQRCRSSLEHLHAALRSWRLLREDAQILLRYFDDLLQVSGAAAACDLQPTTSCRTTSSRACWFDVCTCRPRF